MEYEVREYRRGTWLYDGHVPVRVRVIAINWDEYFEPGHDDAPNLNHEGWAFHLQFEYLPSAGRPVRHPEELEACYKGSYDAVARLLRRDQFDRPVGFGESEERMILNADRDFPGIVWDTSDARTR